MVPAVNGDEKEPQTTRTWCGRPESYAGDPSFAAKLIWLNDIYEALTR